MLILTLIFISFIHALNHLSVGYLLLGETDRYFNTKSHQHNLGVEFWDPKNKADRKTCWRLLRTAQGRKNCSLNCSQSSFTFCFLLAIFRAVSTFPSPKKKPNSKENPNAGTVRHFFTNTHLVCRSKVCVCFLGQNYLWTIFDYWYCSSFHLVYSLFEPIYIFNCTNFTGNEFLNSSYRKNSRLLSYYQAEGEFFESTINRKFSIISPVFAIARI